MKTEMIYLVWVILNLKDVWEMCTEILKYRWLHGLDVEGLR